MTTKEPKPQYEIKLRFKTDRNLTPHEFSDLLHAVMVQIEDPFVDGESASFSVSDIDVDYDVTDLNWDGFQRTDGLDYL